MMVFKRFDIKVTTHFYLGTCMGFKRGLARTHKVGIGGDI